MTAFLHLPKILPVAPRPLEHELFSAWLDRVAAANYLSTERLVAAFVAARLDQDPSQIDDQCVDFDLPESLREEFRGFCRLPDKATDWPDLKARFPTWRREWCVQQPIDATSPFAWVQLGPWRVPRLFCPSCSTRSTDLPQQVFSLAFLTHCPEHRQVIHDKNASGRRIPNERDAGAVLDFQEVVGGCGRGVPPDASFVGTTSPEAFLGLISDLTEIVMLPAMCEPYLVVDYLVPGFASGRHTVLAYEGRGRRSFSQLGWLARWRIVAAIAGIVVGRLRRVPYYEYPYREPFAEIWSVLPDGGRELLLNKAATWPDGIREQALDIRA